MRFERPLLPAVLVRRYKRFLSDHRLENGQVVVAHCANPGAMTGIAEAGKATWLKPASNPRRKLGWDWELVAADGTLVGCHTGRPNALVEEAIRAGTIAELAGYDSLRREVMCGANSRIDMLLTGQDRPGCYVEVKNCHLRRRAGLAEFPDAVTARGARHMATLAAQVEAGFRAVVVYCVQRADCEAFQVAADIDPGYAAALGDALARGVEALAYSCRLSLEGIVVERRLPVVLA